VEEDEGKEDDLPKADILDVSMEDQEEGVPSVPPSNVSTPPINNIRQGSQSKPNPTEGEQTLVINIQANPNMGSKSTDSVSTANPNMGAITTLSNTGTNANPTVGATTTSNRLKSI
jgi:hypothetical protein